MLFLTFDSYLLKLSQSLNIFTNDEFVEKTQSKYGSVAPGL